MTDEELRHKIANALAGEGVIASDVYLEMADRVIAVLKSEQGDSQ
jgi:hypothetical protein